MEWRHAWAANVYAIVGPDGAGKTTIARAIMDRLARRGVKTWIAWMRSPRIVTLGVLGITRLSKLSRTVRMGDHDDVITDLSHHPFLLHLYSWAVTFDYFLGYLGKVTLPKRLLRRTVFCDRFAWDTLVDLGLISGVDEGFLQFPQGRSYWTSPRGIEASSSPRPARNSFDESRSSPWTRGSHAGSGCTRGSRSDSDSGKSTAGPPPNRRVLLKSRNTSGSVLNDPAAEVPFPVCLTLKYGPDRYLPTREATRLSGVRARGGSGSVGPETRVAPASQSDRSSGHGRDQPTKIAVAAPEFGRIWGGIGTYLGQLLPGIASHHEVTILCGQTRSYETGYRTVPLADGGGVMANYFKFQ